VLNMRRKPVRIPGVSRKPELFQVRPYVHRGKNYVVHLATNYVSEAGYSQG